MVHIAGSLTSSCDENAEIGVFFAEQTRNQHPNQNEQVGVATPPASNPRSRKAAVAQLPDSPDDHISIAKRRQMYLLRMEERRRIHNFREKAVADVSRNLLSADRRDCTFELKISEKTTTSGGADATVKN